jgi:uridylate kinase
MRKYDRILLKLSGEALMGEQKYGIDPIILESYAAQVHEIARTGLEIGIVIGGGNIFRGVSGLSKGFDRVKGDYMGMLATVINGLALQSAIESAGTPVRVMTAVRMEPFAEFYSKTGAIEALEKKQVVIFTAGTGNPYFTTDTASALRAVEIEAEVMLKGTRVDGVYSSDPEKDPKAVKFDEISFDEAIEKQLHIMDLTAFTLCKENNLPLIVFNMNITGNLEKLISGEKIGTFVKI